MTAHKHAKLMADYAADAAETENPHHRWQAKSQLCPDFSDLKEAPRWFPEYEYRRKPRTIIVNGIEVPEPLRSAPKNGSLVFLAWPVGMDYYLSEIWNDKHMIKLWQLKAGLIHETSEAASVHGCAMVAASMQGDGK